MINFIDRIISLLIQLLIFAYQKIISPVKTAIFGPTCRFTPTCSEYTLESFKQYSVPIAFFLSMKRILSCHPFNEGGDDPVPDVFILKFNNKFFTFHSKKMKNSVLKK